MRPLLMITLGTTLLAGCADMPFFGKNAAGGSHPARNADHPRAEAVLSEREYRPVREASVTLREGIRLYNDGDFTNAIARFNAPEIQNASLATRTTALKYTAFSYCVTQRPQQCRQAFDKALRLDANFDLAPGEEGHPMWGPVFDKARASR